MQIFFLKSQISCMVAISKQKKKKFPPLKKKKKKSHIRNGHQRIVDRINTKFRSLVNVSSTEIFYNPDPLQQQLRQSIWEIRYSLSCIIYSNRALPGCCSFFFSSHIAIIFFKFLFCLWNSRFEIFNYYYFIFYGGTKHETRKIFSENISRVSSVWNRNFIKTHKIFSENILGRFLWSSFCFRKTARFAEFCLKPHLIVRKTGRFAEFFFLPEFRKMKKIPQDGPFCGR